MNKTCSPKGIRRLAILALLAMATVGCGSSAQVISGDIASSSAPPAQVDDKQVDDELVDDELVDDEQGEATQPADEPTTAPTAAVLPAPQVQEADDLPVVGAASVMQGDADVAPAVFDEVNRGEIEELLGADAWIFEGAAGQLVTVDVLQLDGNCRQDVDLLLIDPTGERVQDEWVGNGGCHGHGPFKLEIAGEYALVFAGRDGSVIPRVTGEYSFVPSLLTEFDREQAVFDELHSGEISQVFGTDSWVFDGVEGQLVTVDVLQLDGDCRQDVDLMLVDPTGERVQDEWVGNGGCHGHGPFELEMSGQYELVFAGRNGSVIPRKTGEYSFIASFLTEFDREQAVFDRIHDGEISQLFGSDTWVFDGAEDQLVTVDVLQLDGDCRQDVELLLIDPRGERVQDEWVGNGGCNGHGPFELEMSGEYELVFAGRSGSVIPRTTGDYSFVASFLTEFDRAPIVFGAANAGEILQLFGSDAWVFEAVEDQLLTIDVTSIDGDCRQDLDMVLVDPRGDRFGIGGWVGNGGCKGHGPFELEYSGEYAVEFVGGSGSVIEKTTGSYSFVPRLGS